MKLPQQCPTDASPLVGKLIAQLFDRIVTGLLAHMQEAGYTDVRPTHFINVFMYLGLEGMRPAELARRAGMTPQAMGELVTYLERCRYVAREPDPEDGRVRKVVYAPRGLEAAMVVQQYFTGLESDWAALIGDQRLEDMRADLSAILMDSGGEGRGA